jgi:two-component system, sensor histidine kinase
MKQILLVVNDDPAGRYLWVRDLGAAGFDVTEAMTGEQALGTARSRVPALVVLDVKLPGIDGFEVARRLRADPATAKVKILHTSALPDPEALERRSREAGGDGFLPMPYTGEELSQRIRAMLAV